MKSIHNQAKFLFLGIMSILLVSILLSTVEAIPTPRPNGVGGNITYDGNYIVHTFTTDGTFTLENAKNVSILIVGGGGAGGARNDEQGAGGGAGGLLYGENYYIASGVHNITIGLGGISPSNSARGENGGNTTFDGTIIAFGGGGGGASSGTVDYNGINGGSGGGTGNGGGTPGISIQTNYTGLTGYGNPGGGNGPGTVGGGGGGAGQIGGNSTDGSTSGSGGNGLNFTINGSNTYYAGGGGGGYSTAGIGGLGGGGHGCDGTGATYTFAADGVNGTGGGGGGEGWCAGTYGNTAGSGGSGIIIIRYLSEEVTITNTAPANNTITNSSDIIFNCSLTDAPVNITNILLNVTGTYSWTQEITGLNIKSYNASFTNSSVLAGTYNWSCIAYTDVENYSGYSAPFILNKRDNPLIHESNITVSEDETTLLGWCNGTSFDNSNLSYYFKWYKDGILNKSGKNPVAVYEAIGGNITYDGEYVIHTFTTNDNFVVTGDNIQDVEILIIGGGGAGGAQNDEGAGGGGAGGVLYATNYTISPGTHNVIIGLGGISPGNANQGENGGNTSFDSIIAYGGGGGGRSSYYPYGQGLPGGSGGGNGNGDCLTGGDCGPTGTFIGYSTQINYSGFTSYGNQGGYGLAGAAGGGGGANEMGGNSSTGTQSGNGGDGLQFNITGNNTYYAGGGGGGYSLAGIGGLGGGGHGCDGNGATYTFAADGLNGTGSGGGGEGWCDNTYGNTAGSGGSGIVIIRYKAATGDYHQSGIITNVNNVTSETGTWTFECMANDGYYNSSLLNSTEIMITTAPQSILMNPQNNSYVNNPNVNFTYNITSMNNLTNSTVYVYNQTFNGFTLCHQETANTSYPTDDNCNLNYNGNYYLTMNWSIPLNLYDGNYSSSARPNASGPGPFNSGSDYFYINYTKPSGATNNSLWRVKYEDGDSNSSIPTNCWNYGNVLGFRIYSHWDSLGDSYSIGYCYNGSDYIEMYSNFNTGGADVYEESMYWEIPFTTFSLVNQTITTFNPGDGILQTILGIPITLIDGVYRWFVDAFDISGQFSFSENNTFTLDSSSPQIQILYPLAENYSTIVNHINVSFEELNNGTCWYSLDQGITNITYDCYLNITGLSSNEGTNTWTVYANDSANNVNSSSVTFFVDTTDPSIALIYPTNNSYLNNPNINFTWSISDSLTPIIITGDVPANYSLLLDIPIANANNADFSDIRLLDGSDNELPYYIESYNSTSGQVWVRINNNNTIYLKKGYSTSNSNFNTAFIYADDFSTNTTDRYVSNGDCDSWNVQNNGMLLIRIPEGGAYCQVIPNSTYQHMSTNYTIEANVKVDTGDVLACRGGVAGYITDITGTNDGYGFMMDAGNDVYYLEDLRYISGPFVTGNPPGGIAPGFYYNQKLIFSGNNQTATFNSNYSISRIGTESTYGNYGVSSYYCGTGNVTFDYLRAYPNSISPVSYTISTMNGSGIKNTTIYIYNQSGNLVNQTTINDTELSNIFEAVIGLPITLADGIYRWYVNAFDNLGNYAITNNQTFILDTIYPKVNINNPTNGSYYNSTPLLNYTITDSNINNCWYNTGGANISLNCSGNILNVTATEGWNTWTIYGTDYVNNTNSSTVTFYLDTSNPEINLIYPSNNTIINNPNVNFTWNVNDMFGWNPNLNNGLQSYWNFDQGSGIILTDIVDSNNGTLQNSPIWVPGKINYALSFNEASSQYVSITKVPSLEPEELSISLWFKTTDEEAALIRNRYNGYGINLDAGYGAGKIMVEIFDNTPASVLVVSNATYNDNVWHYVVATYNTTQLIVYVDNVIIGTASTTGGIYYNPDGGDITFGRGGGSSSNYYTGLIDESGFWNRSLTASEVATLYNSGNGIAYNYQTSSGIKNSTVYVYNKTFGTGLCYQETTNASNINDGSCVLNYSGSYSGDIQTETYDGDYNTYNTTTGMYINYSTPFGATGAIWSVKDSTRANYSLTNNGAGYDCFNNNVISLRVSATGSVAQWECLNQSNNWIIVRVVIGGSARASEEGIYWNMSSDVYNLINETTVIYPPNTFEIIVGLPILLADGIYRWFVDVFDLAGNKATSETNNFELDATNPNIYFTYPTLPSGNKTSDILRVNVTINDINRNYTVINVYNASGDYYTSNQSTDNIFYTTFSLPNGIYYYNATTYDYASNTNSTETRNVTVDIPPSVTFINQTPSDISSLNLFGGTGLRINYDISASADSLNLSSILLHYQTNSTTNNYLFVINGTAYGGWNNASYTTRTDNTTLFRLFDNNVYPAVYNLPERGVELTPHGVNTISGINEWVMIELLGVSNTTQYNQFEIMANATSNASGPAQIYYCNSSYVSGDPANVSDCALIYSLAPETPYNHCHSAYSCHMLIPVAINNATGTIGSVTVTSTSRFLFGGAIGSWDVYYVNNITRSTAAEESTDTGNSWVLAPYTFDSHLHQYDGTDTLWYYVTANTIYGNINTSDTRQDLIDLGGLPPTAPQILTPTPGYKRQNINITYTASVSPNGYEIMSYNGTLLNTDQSFNTTIFFNNGTTLNYNFNSATVPDGSYIIKVETTDSFNQTSFGLSGTITIDNTYPQIAFHVPTTENGYYSSGIILYNITASDTNLQLFDIVLYNESVRYRNVTVQNSSPVDFDSVFTFVPNGIYNMNGSVCDYSGNCNYTDTRHIILDTVYPTINYTNPYLTSGFYPYNFIYTNVTAYDLTLANITLVLNGTLPLGGSYYNEQTLTGINTSTANLFYNWTGLSQGFYNLSSYAVDHTGKRTNNTILSYNIDNEAPTINYTYPTPDAGITLVANSFPVNVSADDPNWANMSLTIYDSGNNVVLYNFTTSKIIDITTGNLSDGTYRYTTRAYDTAGNLQTLTRNVTLEYFAIEITTCRELLTPNSNYLVMNDLSTTNGTCLDVLVPGANINCQGHTIIGNAAIRITKVGATLNNCVVIGNNDTSYALKVVGNSPANVIIYNSTFSGSLYGIYMAPESSLAAYNINVYNNVFGIYFNNSNNGNIIDVASFSGNTGDTITLLNVSSNTFNSITLSSAGDSNSDGVIRLYNSSDNYFSASTFTTSASNLFGLNQYSVNNTLYSCTYDSAKENVDGTSQLIRSWGFTGLVQDKGKTELQGATITFTSSVFNNLTVNYSDGRQLTYGYLGGTMVTNSPGYAFSPVIQYMNVFGTTYTSNPYNFSASYLVFTPATASLSITDNTQYTFVLEQEIASNSMTRTAMWLLLGLVFLIGIAASIGFFMVRMREGYSVVDIWKYFMILVIWLVLFTILFWVLSWFIMQSYYPQIPTL